MRIDGPLDTASASQLAAAIAAGSVSSRAAVDACLARIETVNPHIGAVVRLSETALADADTADAALARGRLAGTLHGPLGVQIAAGPWREDRVLAALAVIEAASGG